MNTWNDRDSRTLLREGECKLEQLCWKTGLFSKAEAAVLVLAICSAELQTYVQQPYLTPHYKPPVLSRMDSDLCYSRIAQHRQDRRDPPVGA